MRALRPGRPAPPVPRRAAATAGLLASALLLPAAGAQASSPARAAEPAAAQQPKAPANAAATWMAGQLTDGSNASGDHGLTADIVLALAATGTGGRTADRATDWLAARSTDYIDRGTAGRVFAGGTAKLALTAAVQGRDPRNFGGHDLVRLLLGRMQDNGRFTDDLPSGDGSNQFTQSLAVLALDRTGDLPAKAVDFLAASRCADGGYPLTFKSDPAKCRSHTDSTGLAVQALLGAGRTAAAKPALDWLEKQQLDNGGFRDNGFGTPPPNSNSTALDVQALTAGGRVEAAGRGVNWLRSMQVGCAAPPEDQGAVGYSEPKADGMALRSTAQVVPALAGRSLADVDGKGAADELVPVTCGPGGGTRGPGGSPGGSDGDSDGDGGDDGDGGTGSGPGNGADGGQQPGGDDPTAGGATGGSSTGGGAEPAGASGAIGGKGALASSGTSGALPLTGAAAALLLAGTGSVVAARRRRHAPRGGR
ncbi:peptidase [Streptomyces sp. WMMB303]|uniref:peptidase n=1 Tax=Streptomyces sp. WMMB303 TaxID=3034154 RepID=UPI0023ED36D3|nr:peptidase [Streptomyces sp. WMMB303]MDF4251885.1 peptidase [Streptomyces sp. WMMB303]